MRLWSYKMTPKCYCQHVAVVRTSWTEQNPGRRFYGCPFFGQHRACKFFKWMDPFFGSRPNQVINGLLRRMDRLEALNDIEDEIVINGARIEDEIIINRDGSNVFCKFLIVLVGVVAMCFMFM